MSPSKSQNSSESHLPLKNLRTRRGLATKILGTLQAVDPDPRCELYHETPFQLLVSVVLSAQTTDKMVNRCMTEVYKKGFTPTSVLKMGQPKLLQTIKSIGLAPTKSKNIMRLSAMVMEKHKGQVPNTRAELEALPGVGKKTASVVLGEIFGEPTLAVDTHVYRVTKRLGLHNEASAEKAEKVLLEVVKKSWLPKAHHWFILLGRYRCKAQKPECSDCPVFKLCPSKAGLASYT